MKKIDNFLEKIIEKNSILEQKLNEPNISGQEIAKLSKEISELKTIVDLGKNFFSLKKTIADINEILNSDDEELKILAKEEVKELESEIKELEE